MYRSRPRRSTAAAATLAALFLWCIPATAQERETDAQCCMCASFYKIEGGGGFARHHVGLCGTCGANYEVNYGSLEEAVTAKGDELQNAAAKAMQKRSAFNDWIKQQDAARDSIFGFNGSLAQTSVSMLGIASAGLGGGTARVIPQRFADANTWKWLQKSKTGIVWTQTGMNMAQGYDVREDELNWLNWVGLGTEVLSTEKMLEIARRILLEDVRNGTYITDLERGFAEAAGEGMKNLAGEFLNNLGAALDLIGCLKAAWDMGNAIADWRIARAEARRLAAEIEELENLMVALSNEMKCILAEIENQQGDGGGLAPHGPSLGGGVTGAMRRQEPPELEFPPLPETDGPHPSEGAMHYAEGQLEALQARIDETHLQFLRDVMPNTLRLLALAVQGDATDAPLAARLCADTLPAFQQHARNVGDVIRDCRSIVQGLHADTMDLGETGEDRARFMFLNSGVKFHIADWVPGYDGFGWRGVAPAGAGAAGRIDIESVDDLRLVPPGSYDILWAQNFPQWQQPTVWRTVEIKEGDTIQVRIDSGAKIAPADWVIPIDSNWGWWGAAPVNDANGKPTEWNARINWDVRGDVPIVLPPGQYDIYWAQGFTQRENPVMIASNFTIGGGELKSVPVNSGIRLTGQPELDDYGWWAIVPVGGGEDDWINRCEGATDQPLVVAAGTYDILFDAGLSVDPVRVAEKVSVRAGQLLEVPVR